MNFTESFKRFANPGRTLKDAYEAGKDCAINGPNMTNCHFALFATREMTDEWERGKREALRAISGE